MGASVNRKFASFGSAFVTRGDVEDLLYRPNVIIMSELASINVPMSDSRPMYECKYA